MTISKASLLLCLIVFSALFAPRVVQAEGGCPAGSYPIGGGSAGWVGCAPMGGNDEQQPEERWESRWGSIAIGDGSFGAAEGLSSKAESESAALQRCLSNSHDQKCWIQETYHDQCAALAWGDGGATAFRSPDRDDAEKSAVNSCSKHTSNCKVFYSACSYPQRVQ